MLGSENFMEEPGRLGLHLYYPLRKGIWKPGKRPSETLLSKVLHRKNRGSCLGKIVVNLGKMRRLC